MKKLFDENEKKSAESLANMKNCLAELMVRTAGM